MCLLINLMWLWLSRRYENWGCGELQLPALGYECEGSGGVNWAWQKWRR